MRRRTKKSVRNTPPRMPDEEYSEPASDEVLAEELLPSAPPSTQWEYRPTAYRPSSRVFHAALLISFCFHLSMVTLFSIVIYFPRKDITYYDFRLVQARPQQVAPSSEGVIQRPMLTDPLASNLSEGLPAVDLPTLEFAELHRIRVYRRGLTEAERLFDTPSHHDSWGQFGRGVQRLRRSLRGLALGEGDGAAEVALPSLSEAEATPQPTYRPAPGYQAYIDWGAGEERELLFAPPVRILWEVPPQDFKEPIELVFQINAHGRVINVWSPAVDNLKIVDAIQTTLLQYRFSPLSVEHSAQSEQTGSLHIAPASGEGP